MDLKQDGKNVDENLPILYRKKYIWTELPTLNINNIQGDVITELLKKRKQAQAHAESHTEC
jgi:hypothetical protein